MKYINAKMINNRMDMAGFSEEYINHIVGNLPPYHIVEIVRCENCKYAEVGEKDVWCGLYECYKNKNGFCDEGIE